MIDSELSQFRYISMYAPLSTSRMGVSCGGEQCDQSFISPLVVLTWHFDEPWKPWIHFEIAYVIIQNESPFLLSSY